MNVRGSFHRLGQEAMNSANSMQLNKCRFAGCSDVGWSLRLSSKMTPIFLACDDWDILSLPIMMEEEEDDFVLGLKA